VNVIKTQEMRKLDSDKIRERSLDNFQKKKIFHTNVTHVTITYYIRSEKENHYDIY